jgi:hypothetical protein
MPDRRTTWWERVVAVINNLGFYTRPLYANKKRLFVYHSQEYRGGISAIYTAEIPSRCYHPGKFILASMVLAPLPLEITPRWTTAELQNVPNTAAGFL